jgi:hypothetical protein
MPRLATWCRKRKQKLRHPFTEGGIMAPLIYLITAFLIFRILGLEWHYLADWHLQLNVLRYHSAFPA